MLLGFIADIDINKTSKSMLKQSKIKVRKKVKTTIKNKNQNFESHRRENYLNK